MFPTLYKIDSKGKLREWDVWVDDNQDGSYTIIVSHGLKDGLKQEKTTLINQGKNIGKANETSPQEQAISEAQSKWNKQIDKGYSEDINPTKVLLPMLAKEYKDHKKKILFPCYVQPKLDGVRCLIYLDNGVIKSISRKGKQWKVIQHIENEVVSFFKENPSIILDGELYSDELEFQEIISAVKRDEPNDDTDKIRFHCYDCILTDNLSASFENRWNLIKDLNINNFDIVETTIIENEDELKVTHDKYVQNGYEGLIIRNKSGKYKIDGRSSDLQKYKVFNDAEFVITGIKLDKNDECVFSCITKDGAEFDVKPKGTHEERKAYYSTKYIGKELTVRYFGMTTSEKPEPRFPVGIAIREGY